MARKKHPKISTKSGARAKKHALATPPEEITKGWMTVGFDISLGSVAAAAIAWDAITKQARGPEFFMWRFSPEEDYFSRLLTCVNGHEIILDLQTAMNVVIPLKDIVIAVEEPFPAHGGFTKRGNTQTLKQAAEMGGAFLAGLVRYRFPNILQISNQNWRSLIAAQISEATGEDVTTYPAKWQSPELALRYGCTPRNSGKFRAQQWATDVFEPWWGQAGGKEILDYPPMISGKHGKQPRPKTSRAKAFQPDDRFDALAIMEYGRVEAELING